MIPIYDPDAENAIISSILCDDKSAHEALIILNEDDFYEPINRILFQSIKTMYGLGKKIDLTTLISFLRKEQKLEDVGGSENVSQFIKFNINPENIVWYANIVKEKSLKREIQKRNVLIQENIDSDKTEQWIDEMVELARAIPGDVLSLKKLDILLPDIMKVIEERIASGEGVEGYKTQFNSLDKMLLGLRKKELFIIAARTGVGKTCLGLNLALNFVKHKIPVLFFSFEMGVENLSERLLAMESRLTYNKVISGQLEENEISKLANTICYLETLPLTFVDDYNRSVVRIEKTIREFKLKNPDFVCVIDYLQQVFTTYGNTREQEVADVSRRLKALAMENNIPIIALAQLSHSVENRGKNAKPILSDLRESGAIEQDADIILFLHRNQDKIYEENDTETVELFLAKRRNGMTGKTKLTFHKNYTRFDNYIEEPI